MIQKFHTQPGNYTFGHNKYHSLAPDAWLMPLVSCWNHGGGVLWGIGRAGRPTFSALPAARPARIFSPSSPGDHWFRETNLEVAVFQVPPLHLL